VVKRLILAALLCAPIARAEEPSLTLSAPEGAVTGDGKTVVGLTLTTAPQAPGKPITNVALDAAAGRVGKIEALGDGRYRLEYVPPRVAGPHLLAVTSTASYAGHLVRSAPLTLQVVPPSEPEKSVATGGPIDLRGPEHVLRGGDRPAELTVAAVKPTPMVVASAGTVGPLERGRDGRLHARYTPPVEKYPQVAIVAAISGARAAWLPIPLVGIGEVEVRTKAGARVTLTVAGVEYGPVRADGQGRALMEMSAPPGVKQGRTSAVDALGNAREAPLDLGVPPFNRLLAACAPGVVHLFAVDASGRPSSSPAPQVRLDDRPLSLEPAEPGHFVAHVDQPGATVRATLPSDARSQSSCTFPDPGEPPDAIALTVEPIRFVAGSHATVTVHATLHHPGHGKPAPVTVTFDPDFGHIEGEHWILPDRFDGRRQAVLRAHAGALTAEAKLILEPGPIAALELERPRGRVVGDGKHTLTLPVRAHDAFGNPVEHPRVEAHATGAVRVDGGQLAWTPPRGAREDRIEVRDLDAGQKTTLKLTLDKPRMPFSVGARVGYLTNFGKISAPVVSLDFAWRLPWLRRLLSIGLESGVYYATFHGASAAGDPIDLSVTGVPVAARIDAALPLGPAALYAGVGGGLLVPRTSVASANAPSQDSTSALGLFTARVGADFDVRRGRLVLEAGYLYAPSSDGGLTGNFGGLSITAGWRAEL
jgi:hypothetical protein